MNASLRPNKVTVSALAHEIRNPLASILSSVELIQALGQHAKEVPDLLDTVNTKVSTMAVILEQFISAWGPNESAQSISDHADQNTHTGSFSTIAAAASVSRVLIVDDNVSAAATLGQLLSLQGYLITVAHSGAEGLILARTFQPQIALLDIGMPGMDGYQLAQLLRAEHPHCTCIALTGYDRDEDRARAKNAGFEFHLTKPSRVREIVSLLESITASIKK